MEEALTIMASGMITIFVILSLVVLMGNGLIRLVNRWAPAPADVPRVSSSNTNTNNIKSSTLAAIVAAVDLTTKGKGKVVSIKKKEEL